MDLYARLAQTLDALPNGFPSTGDGSELRLLQKLFTPEAAELALLLTPQFEPVEQIAARSGRPAVELRKQLKNMVRRGLISTGRTENGLGFGLMPFVVGIYEMQGETIDVELAQLVEAYFQRAFAPALRVAPQFHRIVPVNENIRNSMEIHPHESATGLVEAAQAWGVIDCICRKQKTLIGEGCEHPLDVCMVLSEYPDAFDGNPTVRALTHAEALATLKRAAEAGLVHSVSNNQRGIHYICNCCTCSCGLLRGMANLGIANVMARSAFVNTVDETLCNACENCVSYCQFNALSLEIVLQVNALRCVGCGICVPACPSAALALVRRPEAEILPIPATLADWGQQRAAFRALEGH
jgi:Na+-translocating ferredoxin:NAD+ oxidoreductase subunit B